MKVSCSPNDIDYWSIKDKEVFLGAGLNRCSIFFFNRQRYNSKQLLTNSLEVLAVGLRKFKGFRRKDKVEGR